MASKTNTTLSGTDLSEIRDAVPTLDLLAIRSLRRAGFEIVRRSDEPEHHDAQGRSEDWNNRRISSAA